MSCIFAVGRDCLIETFFALVREVISLFLRAASTSDLIDLGVGVTSDDDDDSAAERFDEILLMSLREAPSGGENN